MDANGADHQRPAGDLDGALAELAATLRTVLRQPEDLPEALLHRAAADPFFLNALIAHRDDPAALDALLAATPRSLPKWAGPPSSVLLLRAAKALVRWGRAGFRETDPQTFEQRRKACLECPHLGSPGEQLAYKITRTQEKSLCGLCGCAVDRKARLPTEECPAPHPTDPGMTRWGEPVS